MRVQALPRTSRRQLSARSWRRTGIDALTRLSRTMFRRRPAYVVIVIMIILFVSGMATGFDLAVRLNYVFGIVLLVSFLWARWGTDRLTATVERPRGDLSVGDEIHEVITVRNNGGPPRAWLEIEDVTDLPGVKLGRVVSLPGIVTFQRVEARARLTQRGEYNLGPLVIRSADPFGIFPQEIRLAEARKLRVFPRIIELPDFILQATEISGEHARRRRSPILSPEVSSVREYQPGDAISRIHWPSTARTARLMVKLFDQGRAGEVWVIFDQDGSAQAGSGADSTDEYGATIAASTAHKYLTMQLPVGYVAYGSRSLVLAPERGSAQRQAIFDHLAVSRPTGDRPLFKALADIERELGRSSSIVVITAAPDGDWIDALSTLQRRGVRATVVLFDPASFGADRTVDSPRARLVGAALRTFVLRRGAPIQAALTEPEAFVIRQSTNGRKPFEEPLR
ncbi:MAG: DUF58 domain-containing protein [Chloroflexi bacterium]|nr:DUF58 domain-containing protein [Chloroflexota bacterium]